MKKFQVKKWMYTACSLLLSLPTFAHWNHISIIFLGELPYPTEED